MEKGTFISSVSPYPEEEYYLGKSSWSATASDWDQRFEVGDVIADPSGSWTPGTAEQYIDSQIATVNGNLASETLARQTADQSLQNQINAEATTRANVDNTKADKATTLAGYGITNAYTKTEVNDLVDTPHQNYVTVQTYSALPASGSADTIYRVSNYDGSVPEVNVTKYSEYAWSTSQSQYIFLCVKSQIDEVFDITVYHSNTTYSDLAAALGTDGDNVPPTLRRGGMSIKYIQTPDNKYVQYMCKTNTWSSTPTDWEKVNNVNVSENTLYIGDESKGELGGQLVESLDWVRVVTDANKKILYGVKTDGKFYFGDGCPPQVVAYVQGLIVSYHGDDILSFLDNLEMGDENLRQMLNERGEYIESSEWVEVHTDSNKKILYGVKTDGKFYADFASIDKGLNAKHFILDCDFGGDIDDLGAVAVACWAEREGLINLLGVNISEIAIGEKSNTYYDNAKAISSLCNYFGMPNVPIGADFHIGSRGSAYCYSVEQYEHYIGSINYSYDSVEFYRKILASLPEGETCDVATTGYTTGFYRFLASPADSISNKTGLQLASKIRKLWVVGGKFPNGVIDTNLSGGGGYYTDASQYILSHFPNNIIFLGLNDIGGRGGMILYNEERTWSILYKGMDEYMTTIYNADPAAYDNNIANCWKAHASIADQRLVLAAVEDNLSLSGYDTHRGTCSMVTDSDSPDYMKNVWVDDPNGKHYYLTSQPMRNPTWFTQRVDEIMKDEQYGHHFYRGNRLPLIQGTIRTSEYDIVIPAAQGSSMSFTVKARHIYEMSVPSDHELSGAIHIFSDSERWVTSSKKLELTNNKKRGYFYSEKDSEYLYYLKYNTVNETVHVKETWVE